MGIAQAIGGSISGGKSNVGNSLGRGNVPKLDGETNLYKPEGLSKARPRTRIIYVNGMNTTGSEHKETAILLTNVVEGEVVGVHNLTGFDDTRKMINLSSRIIGSALPDVATEKLKVVGQKASSLLYFLQDGYQCIEDYLLPMRAMKWVSESFVADWLTDTVGTPTQSAKYQMALIVLQSNKASVSLFKLLYREMSAGKSVHLIAHSQGNLISVNVLYCLQWALGSLDGLYYYGMASPSPSWPKELNAVLYTHSDDPIPRLSLGRSFKKNDAVVRPGQHKLPVSFKAHDVTGHIVDTPFSKLIRKRLSLSPQMSKAG